jgi:hypothetical protein
MPARPEPARCDPGLLELQRTLRAQLLGDAPAADGAAALRLAIYRNTCIRTLLSALRLSYPAVQRLVGAEFFVGAAREFIRVSPPAGACLNDYGAPFAAFLEAFAPAATLPYLADVARLEWAVNCALHADDAPGLDLARLAGLAEAARARVSFTAHPAVRLLQLRFPADAIWRAVLAQDGAAMAAIGLAAGPVHLLVERGADGVQVRRLNGARWQFAARLCAGEPLHTMIEPGSDADISGWLAEHLASGRLIDFRLHGATC